jgi:iron only hydrogenase large subunit-like protein
MSEAKELAEKGFLTSSCCPAFVKYVETQFPALKNAVSSGLSPMAVIAKYIKSTDSDAKIIFIGPCIAKKSEFQKKEVRPYVDSVITFEELQALFDSKDIELASLEESSLDNASYYGRIFARSGGLSDAVKEALKESGITDFEYKPEVCDGIEQCRTALLKASKNMLPSNFIEGMACVSGCIGGAGCLTHGEKNRRDVDKYGMEAYEKTISDAVNGIPGITDKNNAERT